MPTTLVVRPAPVADLQVIGGFIADPGYTAQREVLLAVLGPMLGDRRYIRLKGEAEDLGVKGLAAERGWVRLEAIVTRRRELV